MPETAALQNTPGRLDWYLEAKFGLFIHWGAYAVAGVEASWSMMAPDLAQMLFGTRIRIQEADYVELPNRFNPVDFNAEAWVRIAQMAGMRYIVFTAKHHDGFCMFDAPGTEYKITNTPFGKDVCLELAQACAAAGMPLGFYYSPPDMHHPGYRDKRQPAHKNWLGEPGRSAWSSYLDTMESHLRKLLTGYGKISLLWFDGLVNHAKYDPPRFHRLVHKLSPDTLINDRLGDGYDFITPEQFIPTHGIPVRTGKPPSSNDVGSERFFRLVIFLYRIPILRDALTRQLEKYASGELELTSVPEELYPPADRFQPWETCMTMGRSWAYNPQEAAWKTPQELVRNLVDVVSAGGNYLLNVGPTALGAFPPEALQRLQQVGRWVHCYPRAIFGTTYTPLRGNSGLRTTRRGNTLFLYLTNGFTDNNLVIDPFPGMARKVSLYSGEPLSFSCAGGRLEIELPAQAPDPDASVLAVEIDSTEPGWCAFSQPASPARSGSQYLRLNMPFSALINAGLNGLIAFFAYRGRVSLPFAEIQVDILITVAVISFLVSWIAIVLTRQQLEQGKLVMEAHTHSRLYAAFLHRLKLPQSALWRALVIALGCVLVFGGLLVGGLVYLFCPQGLGNWVYIGLKTLYTGLCAALAAGMGIYSVYNEYNRR